MSSRTCSDTSRRLGSMVPSRFPRSGTSRWTGSTLTDDAIQELNDMYFRLGGQPAKRIAYETDYDRNPETAPCRTKRRRK